MSVALVVKKVDGVEPGAEDNFGYTPVSVERFWFDGWLPVCDLYGLKWIALFNTAYQFESEHIPLILEELYILKSHFAEIESEYLKERADLLINRFEALKGKDVEYFIG